MLRAMRQNAGREMGDMDAPPIGSEIEFGNNGRKKSMFGSTKGFRWSLNGSRSGPPGPSVVDEPVDDSAAVAPQKHIEPLVVSDAVAPTKADVKLKSWPIFNNSDADRDGLLSRSEFTNALQMFMYSEKEDALFNILTVEEIDEQYGLAGGDDGKDEVSASMFDVWVHKFRESTLEYHR